MKSDKNDPETPTDPTSETPMGSTPEAAPADSTTPVAPPAISDGKGRRLSVLRMGMAAMVIAAAGLGSTKVTIQTLEARHEGSNRWFAPYVDVTLPPYFSFQDPAANPNEDVVLSFVVAAKEEPCTPSWGASFDLDAAASELDMDRRIVRHRQRGGDVIVSFGGVANDELATSCTDPEALADAYRSVVDRYELRAIDLDIEVGGLDSAASARRATAIAQVQSEAKEEGRELDVWVTLPVAPDGLQQPGVEVVDGLLRAEVDLTGLNIMTMEFGESRPSGMDFVDASLSAVDAAAGQLRSAYLRAGRTLDVAASYAKIGVTPMIGQNDFAADRLDLDGARKLVDRASDRGVLRFSMWSLNRDIACGANVDPTVANNTCSGVEQEVLEFSRTFGGGDGRATGGAPAVEAAPHNGRGAGALETSGPAPYDEWRPRREYEVATKVVWRGQVYEAKWWNVSAQPDAPVEHEWDSPWRVLGPVLATDRPASATRETIPDGTYPEWDPEATYLPADRVQLRGVGYRAKWWTRGEDPTADVDNEWESAWDPLAPADIPPSDLPPGDEGGDAPAS